MKKVIFNDQEKHEFSKNALENARIKEKEEKLDEVLKELKFPEDAISILKCDENLDLSRGFVGVHFLDSDSPDTSPLVFKLFQIGGDGEAEVLFKLQPGMDVDIKDGYIVVFYNCRELHLRNGLRTKWVLEAA